MELIDNHSLTKHHGTRKLAIAAFFVGVLFGVASLVYIYSSGFRYWVIGRARNGYTIVPKIYDVKVLNSVANDPIEVPGKRAMAIFEIFAHNVQPGISSNELHGIFANTTWLNEAEIEESPDSSGGKNVPECGEDHTNFNMRLFAAQTRDRPWVISFCLSSPNLPAGDAIKFFEGKLSEGVEISQFALRFPHSYKTGGLGRTEVFSKWKIVVYDE